jgi:hypothetical protein
MYHKMTFWPNDVPPTAFWPNDVVFTFVKK